MEKSELQSFWIILEEIVRQVRDALCRVKEEEIKALIESLLRLTDGRRLFVIGAGRSGLVGRAFAMRMMQLGLNAFVVGETTTPALEKGDLLMTISRSGRTRTVLEIAKIAKRYKAQIITITSYKRTPLGRISNLIVRIPGRVKPLNKDHRISSYSPEIPLNPLPLGTQFEIACMIFLDTVISELMVRLKLREEDLRRRHTNLE